MSNPDAIITKQQAPTQTRGTKIRATYMGHTAITSFNHELSVIQNHALAARKAFLEFTGNKRTDDIWAQHNTDTGFIFVKVTQTWQM